MSYTHGQGLILELLLEMDEFTTLNAGIQRRGWRLFPTGNSPYYAILRRGPSSFDYDSLGRGSVQISHRTVIELWQQWVNVTETTELIDDLADAIVEHLEQYPTLGDDDNISVAFPAGTSDTQWIIPEGQTEPAWARLEVYVDWQEERII